MRAEMNNMIGQMAIAKVLPGFNDLGPLLFFGWTFSTPIFYVWRENEENLSTRSLIFLQNAPSSSIPFSTLFCEKVGKT